MIACIMYNFKELSLQKCGLKSTKQRKLNMEHFMKTDFKRESEMFNDTIIYVNS